MSLSRCGLGVPVEALGRGERTAIWSVAGIRTASPSRLRRNSSLFSSSSSSCYLPTVSMVTMADFYKSRWVSPPPDAIVIFPTSHQRAFSSSPSSGTRQSLLLSASPKPLPLSCTETCITYPPCPACPNFCGIYFSSHSKYSPSPHRHHHLIVRERESVPDTIFAVIKHTSLL